MADGRVILMAEDLEDDVFLARRAFEKAGITNPLFVVRDGDEAISYLSGTGKYDAREEFPLPALLLLDLKMPGVDGFGVLRWLKQQPELCNLPVVVLTSSEAIRDVEQAYRLGASSFIVKPADFQDTVCLFKTITEYWLGMNKATEISRPAPPQPNKTIKPSTT